MDDINEPRAICGDEYQALRARVVELVAAQDAAVLDAPSPATPEWRVRDVLAHMVGVVDDALNVRFDGAPGEAWTAKQVEARRDHSVAEMLEEWQQLSPAFEGALATLPFAMAGQALFDAVTHEHDIRCALHSPGGRDAPAVGVAFDWLVEMRRSVQAPAIRFDTDAGVMIAGTGDIVATIGAPRFEIVRATTGRRSASEIAAYNWDPEPDPSLLVGDGVLFHVRNEPLNE